MLDRRTLVAGGLATSLCVTTGFAQTVPRRFAQDEIINPVAPDDLALIKERLAGFFDRAVIISTASPPPGANASNGWFVNGMKSDAELEILQRPFELDSGGGRMLGMFSIDLMQSIRAGFAPGLHFATGLTYLPLATEVIGAALPQIAAIVVEIVKAYYTEGASIAADSDSIMDKINGLGDAVARSGNVSSGEHANGYISTDTRDRTAECSQRITQLADGLPARARDFNNVLKAICNSFGKLRTDGHDPWLRAEWQLGFTGICMAGSKAMKGLIA